MRKGEELKAPRYASAAATRDGKLPYVTAICLIPDSSLIFPASSIKIINNTLIEDYKALITQGRPAKFPIILYRYIRLTETKVYI